MTKAELFKELETEFNKLKNESGLQSSLEELDKYFFIKDSILEKGFVSSNLSNQLRSRLIDVVVSWDNYLHGLVMPNPQNLFSINEAKALNESDKKEIMKIMSRAAYFVAKSGGIRLKKDKQAEAKFIDEVLGFWKDTYEPLFLKLLEKIEEHWKEVKENKEKL